MMEGDNQSGSDEENSKQLTSPELDATFKKSFYLEREEAITLKKNYILHMSSANVEPDCKLALGLSSYETCVYSVGHSLKCVNTLPSETNPIINVRFAPDNPSLLYVGCSRGVITLWDLRNTNKFAQEFKDTSEPKSKNLHEKSFCSMDVNCDGRFLCAGTEVTDGDAFLLFWDTRKNSLLGGYWDCHTDDVTQVNFDPKKADRLITGSVDGLINVYDISQSEEEEALLQSLNTESSVEKLCWHEDTISCITHTADVQLWHTEDSAPYTCYSRAAIAAALQMSSDELANSLYVADVHSTAESDQMLILAGSNIASGRCLRSAVTKGRKLIPQSYFDGNKQIVRCSWYDPQKELLVTGGEAGILSIWKAGSACENYLTSSNKLKATSKFKEKPHQVKAKPY